VANELVPRARRGRRSLSVLALSGLVAALTGLAPVAVSAATPPTYENPLNVRTPGGTFVETCADPSVIRGQREQDRPAGSPTNHRYWYMYCTTDPLHTSDKNSEGQFRFRKIPMFRSADLVNWTYMGDAFKAHGVAGSNFPEIADPSSALWAPEIDFYNGKYYMYFGVTNTDDDDSPDSHAGCIHDNSIGVATSNSPLGPWVAEPNPVVYPRRNGGDLCNFFWTFDPEVITGPAGQKYIYYGSYYGGVHVRKLSANGFTSDPASAKQVAIANRYEGPEVMYRGGYYYMWVSAANCCNAQLTGYSVFAGRSRTPEGPFVDQTGQDFMDRQPGGFPSLSMNGNRWIGLGHNTVFNDMGGRTWTIYHAVNRFDPCFAGTQGPDGCFTKRPALMDPIVWEGRTATDPGWPNVRGGRWASAVGDKIPGPAAQPGDVSGYKNETHWDSGPNEYRPRYSDEFNGTSLDPKWSWVRQPESGYNVSGGSFNWEVQNGDLYRNDNNASVLTLPSPPGDYVVEIKVQLSVPNEPECCYNYQQAGIAIYGDDDHFLRLTHTSIWETRQTEFAKEDVYPVQGAFYGNTVVGPPGEPDGWTWLRIIRTEQLGKEFYKAFTSRDGTNWYRGGTWTHQLGSSAKLGLIAQGYGAAASENAPRATAKFDYIRTYNLHVRPPAY